MKRISFLMIFLLLVVIGCAWQPPPVLREPTTPRVIVKEIPTEREPKEEKEEFFGTAPYLYPDITRGYIENKAYPYTPKVWVLVDGTERLLLIGPELGPPEVFIGEIREFNLPPGDHIFHIERWQYTPHYGGWRKISKVEVVKLSIAQFSPRGRQYWIDHYGWWLIIKSNRTTAYSGYVK